ncbi:MAG: sulfatase-like hydrolase/transferase [Ferruginibacter sp.]
MFRVKPFFTHRYGPVAVIVLMVCVISFCTRLVLFVKSWPYLDITFLNVTGVFVIGLLYDVVVGLFFAIPVALYCWLMKDSWYQKKWQRIPLFTFFSILTFILLICAGSEIGFWHEFNVRFNFIAVDYIFYTNEVVGSILESYNFTYIFGGILIVSIALLLVFRKLLFQSQQSSMRFGARSRFFVLFLLLPLAGYFLVSNNYKKFSSNNYINELAGNGLYEFGASFWSNSLNYDQFYADRDEATNFALLRKMLQAPNATFTGDSLSIDREIKYDSPEHKWNVVLISVESLSGDYLQYFGNKENITPHLDSLIPKSLFFKNFYASGTRTVRGLEALSLSIPPTPGQSILRRPNNEGMFTLGSVFKSKGYDVGFIYGGNSFFDNMGYFFGHNGYKVSDIDDIPSSFVHHTTSWGIDDEATLNFSLKECDDSYNNKKLFFNHIMTVSNHRPYTYPDGRIDIKSETRSPQGGVKYTDYALNKFLKDASKKPWFDNTIFVMVADHCSHSAGKTDLPVNHYHIPCFIYAPKLITPSVEQKFTSQIDLAPTILGLLNMNYTSRFFGMDILHTPDTQNRIFLSTYQKLGYLRDNKIVILSPHKKIETYRPDFNTGTGTKAPASDNLVSEAIAWYEGASYLFKNGKYKSIP